MKRKILFLTFAVCALMGSINIQAELPRVALPKALPHISRINKGYDYSITVHVNKPQGWQGVYAYVTDPNYDVYEGYNLSQEVGDIYTFTYNYNAAYEYVIFYNTDGSEYGVAQLPLESDNFCFRLGNDVLQDGYGDSYITCESIDCDQLYNQPYYGVCNLKSIGTSIEDWVTGDYATLNASSSSSTKYSYDVEANDGNDVYLSSIPNIIFRTKHTSGKSNAFAICPGNRFIYGGKNGIILIKNTNAEDTIRITVASKGTTDANFFDTSGAYPENAVALSSDLTLPTYGSDETSSEPYVWRELTYLSFGGDVKIKEVAGGFAIKKIVISNESHPVIEKEPITVRLTSPSTFTNPYIYAWDNNYNEPAGSWPGTPMTSLGDRQYTFTFAENISSVNIIFNDYNNSGNQTSDIYNVTNSTCYKLTGSYDYNGHLDYAQIDCSEEPEPIVIDTLNIRLNPFTVDWSDAYLYVWNGRTSYNNSYSAKIVPAQRMTLAEDGWWTYSFEMERGLGFYVGFDYQSDNSPYYTYYDDNYNTALCFESTCFEYNSGLVATTCKKLTPDETSTFTVHVATPGTLGQVMVQTLGDLTWTDVFALTVTGSLNETDKTYFSRMTNLQQLDLSGTNLISIGECGSLEKLSNVVLPETCVSINSNAFYNCKRLTTINLEHVQSIGNYAFYECSLLSANMPNVQSIGNYAFYDNTLLASLSMPLASSIGQYAFYSCYALEQVDMPNVTTLGVYAFAMNNSSYSLLSQVTFSNKLTEIPNYCFYGCSVLTSLTLPDALTTIGNSALPSVSDVYLPAKVTSVGSGNFSNATSINIPADVMTWKSYSSSWNDVYCSIVVPPAFSVFDVSGVATATLHVPSISLAAYKLHDMWYKFGRIIPMDGEVEDIAITSDFMLLTTDGIAENANLSIVNNGALTMSAADTLVVGNYVQQISSMQAKTVYESYTYDENGNYIQPYSSNLQYTGVLVANSPISANSVTVQLVPRANQWNFFSLPFDVNMSDITIETEGTGTVGTSQWVIREYSGANRAAGYETTWINVPANGVLHAHTGYILYWVVSGSSTYMNNSSSSSAKLLYYFNMPAVNNDNMQQIFATGDMNVPLTEYVAEFPQNGSWNLVGNPYPCAFDIQQMDFEAPITIWNGSGYEAYSLEDDQYALRPAEAFFVQAPEGTSQITFHKEGRLASIVVGQGYYAPARSHANNTARKVFNFILSNADYSDRARLVLNANASADYEITRDAAKMMSSDNTIPQLYINNNGVRYAIDERPEQSSYILGAYFGQTGEYTLHLNMSDNEERMIILTDNVANVATDLSAADYTFITEAGTFNSRFTISLISRMPTNLEETQSLIKPMKTIENGNLIIVSPQGKKYTVGGIEL